MQLDLRLLQMMRRHRGLRRGRREATRLLPDGLLEVGLRALGRRRPVHHLGVHPLDDRLDTRLGFITGEQGGMLREGQTVQRHGRFEALRRADAEDAPRLPEDEHPVQHPLHRESADGECAVGGRRREAQQARIGGGLLPDIREGAGLPDPAFDGLGQLAEGELHRGRIDPTIPDGPTGPEQFRAAVERQVREPGVAIVLGDDSVERHEGRLEGGGPAEGERETGQGA